MSARVNENVYNVYSDCGWVYIFLIDDSDNHLNLFKIGHTTKTIPERQRGVEAELRTAGYPNARVSPVCWINRNAKFEKMLLDITESNQFPIENAMAEFTQSTGI